MQSALIVQSQRERRRRELLQRRTTRGILTQRGINSDADTQTPLHMNYIKKEMRREGSSQKLVYMQISLHWGDGKTANTWEKKTLVLFLPSD